MTIDELLTVEMKNVKPLYLSNLRFLRKRYSMTQQDISDLLLLFTANFGARQKERVDSECLPAFLFD